MHIRKVTSRSFSFLRFVSYTLVFPLFQSLCNSSHSQLYLHTLLMSAGSWHLRSRLEKRFRILQVSGYRALSADLFLAQRVASPSKAFVTCKAFLLDVTLRDENLLSESRRTGTDSSSRSPLLEVASRLRCLVQAAQSPLSLLGARGAL